LRTGEDGRTLEISCRTLYMRCSDAAIEPSHAGESELGEPPAVWERRTVDDILASIEHDLIDVQTLRLAEPEWLENMAGAATLADIISAFRARGGRVE